jgi:hypothetical protein
MLEVVAREARLSITSVSAVPSRRALAYLTILIVLLAYQLPVNLPPQHRLAGWDTRRAAGARVDIASVRESPLSRGSSWKTKSRLNPNAISLFGALDEGEAGQYHEQAVIGYAE